MDDAHAAALLSRRALNAEVDELDAELRAAGSQERAEQERRYLKSELVHYGASVPAIRRVTLAFLEKRREGTGGEPAPAELRALAEALWDVGVFDLRFAAAELLTACAGSLDVADLSWLEPLLRRSHTWALVDGLAVDVVGNVLARRPRAAPALLKRWARDSDIWIRRSALLSLLRRLRAGDAAAFARFTALADPMLDDREFFIRKAIGWSLREYAKRQPQAVYDWLRPRAGRASGLTLREASKPLPRERRDALLAAHKGDPRGGKRASPRGKGA